MYIFILGMHTKQILGRKKNQKLERKVTTVIILEINSYVPLKLKYFGLASGAHIQQEQSPL